MCISSTEYVTACSTSGRDEMTTGKNWASSYGREGMALVR
jgi:hypothetical protein